MNLSSDQILAIQLEVERSKVTTLSLKDDLIDHLCCEMENKLALGKDFTICLRESINDLAPQGLHNIQKETDFLLEPKYQSMKKLTYLIGLITAMMMSFGWLLRVLRMGEVGNQVFAFGVLGFIVLFLPMLAVLYFRANRERPWYAKWQMVLGVVSILFVGLAWLFKIMHMPGADEVLLLGGVLFTFGFLPFLFLNFYKKSEIRII
jgi:hypothetical protein